MRLVSLLTMMILVALLPGAAIAAGKGAPVTRGPSTPAEMEAFVDGVVTALMRDKHVAGVTFAAVVDDKPFFAKGYGYVDVAAKKPVDAGSSMFRIGSISKLLTWTAVMQLVEQGKLDLEADVNSYLKDFQIPATFPEPIRLKDLLTHTPGFEDSVIGLFAKSHEQCSPLGQVLSRDLPARVLPAGKFASYSNHGTALAGHIVATVSGMSWEEYVERNILKPLGMTHTSIRQPALEALSPDISKGYTYESGHFVEKPFEYIPIGPAGCASASSGDMARFIIAYLQEGQLGDTSILRKETVRRMRTPLFTHDPRLPGMGYGFWRMDCNGESIIQHGGDTLYFHSFLAILPERHTGWFISCNTDAGVPLVRNTFRTIMDHYYPDTAARTEGTGKPAEQLDRYTGTYAGLRHSYTSIAKLADLGAAATISRDGNELILSTGSGSRRYVETETGMFREIDGPDTLLFADDGKGGISHLYLGTVPAMDFVRLQWYETPAFRLSLIGGSLCIVLIVLLGWPIIGIATWGLLPKRPMGARLATWLAWLTSAAIMAVFVMMGVALADGEQIVFGAPPVLKFIYLGAQVVAGLVAVLTLFTLLVWALRYWGVWARLRFTLFLLAAVAVVWFFHEYNVLQFTAPA